MSRQRHVKSRHLNPALDGKVGVHGNPLCRACGKETTAKRRNFCNKACVEKWRLASDSSFIRRQVWLRDLGVCAACGLDTKVLSRKFRRKIRETREAYRRRVTPWCKQNGFDVPALGNSIVFWHADHIVPVAQGGGGAPLSFIQTLCVPCHKQKTKRQLQQSRRGLDCRK